MSTSHETLSALPKTAVAERLAQKIAALDAAKLPPAVRRKCGELLIDVIGLAVHGPSSSQAAMTLLT